MERKFEITFEEDFEAMNWVVDFLKSRLNLDEDTAVEVGSELYMTVSRKVGITVDPERTQKKVLEELASMLFD